MATVPRAYLDAAERWGFLADAQAHKYGLPNGATLLLKIASGESNFNMKAVSSANARGATQFIPSTREAYIQQYHVDPWKSVDEAMHATAIYMAKSGLAAYNPGGGQGYIDYILEQPVSSKSEAAKGKASPRSGHVAGQSPSTPGGGGVAADLMHAGLVAVLVIGGIGLMILGSTRLLGASKAGKAAQES